MYEIEKETTNYLDLKLKGKIDKSEYKKILTVLESKLESVDEIDLLVIRQV